MKQHMDTWAMGAVALVLVGAVGFGFWQQGQQERERQDRVSQLIEVMR